jgi:hypothetical protein
MESSRSGTPSLNSGVVAVRRIILACIFVLTIAYALAYSVERSRRRLVQELTIDAQQLRVGVTTEAEIQALAKKYKGTYFNAEKHGDSEEPAHYSVAIWSPMLAVGQNYKTLPGRRAWGALAYLPVENGHLSRVYFELGSRCSDGLELSASVRFVGSTPFAAPRGVSYYVYEAHVTGPPTESLNVELSAAATSEEYKKGFDFNLSCLTRLSECRHVCELMPTAWKDLPSERRIKYGDGRNEMMDSECRKQMH